MRFLLPFLALISLTFGAAILYRDDVVLTVNETDVPVETADTQAKLYGMVQFFTKPQYRGTYAWFMDMDELNTHWKDIAYCRNIDPKYSFSINFKPIGGGIHWGCRVWEKPGCNGANYWYQQSQPTLWATRYHPGWEHRIRSAKCYIDF